MYSIRFVLFFAFRDLDPTNWMACQYYPRTSRANGNYELNFSVDGAECLFISQKNWRKNYQCELLPYNEVPTNLNFESTVARLCIACIRCALKTKLGSDSIVFVKICGSNS